MHNWVCDISHAQTKKKIIIWLLMCTPEQFTERVISSEGVHTHQTDLHSSLCVEDELRNLSIFY